MLLRKYGLEEDEEEESGSAAAWKKKIEKQNWENWQQEVDKTSSLKWYKKVKKRMGQRNMRFMRESCGSTVEVPVEVRLWRVV